MPHEREYAIFFPCEFCGRTTKHLLKFDHNNEASDLECTRCLRKIEAVTRARQEVPRVA